MKKCVVFLLCFDLAVMQIKRSAGHRVLKHSMVIFDMEKNLALYVD